MDRVHNLALKSEKDCKPRTQPDPHVPEPKPLNALPPFTFKSGPEVFQRGLRAFRDLGCIDCHDGPLFSEIYLRGQQAEFGEVKMQPIGRQVRNTLLPVSRGDAHDFKYQAARERVLRRVVALLIEARHAGRPTPLEVMDYVALFEKAGGRQSELAKEVGTLLQASRLAPAPGESGEQRKEREGRIADLAGRIAKTWTTFEMTFPLGLGDRHCFNEDERVAMASTLAAPLFIETMPIPSGFLSARPLCPIPGPRALAPYALYNTSFYVLNSSLQQGK